MEIGIGLPNAVPGTSGDQLTEWARRADAAGFSSLGVIDRIVYPNLEPFVALAAAAAVTERIRLGTTILIAPFRVNAALIAKQAASIHTISGGRMSLGIAVGGREDDYQVAGVDFDSRGERFEEMLAGIVRTWAESSGNRSANAVGPDVAVNRPELILGGEIDAAFRRAAAYGQGWNMGGGPPEAFVAGRARLDAAWAKAGRTGTPRAMAQAYFSLGDAAEEHARSYLLDYYAWLGDDSEEIAASAATDETAVKRCVGAFEQAGCDELVLFPTTSDPEQVDLLAAAIGPS